LRQLARGRYITVKRGSNELVLHPLDKEYSYRQIPRAAGEPYGLANLERRAADYYAQLRLPPDTWKSIRDFEPQFAEFEHLVRAGDYDAAARLIDTIDAGYLVPWGHARRVLNMREQLTPHISDPLLRESNQGRLGVVYHTMGQVDQAIKFYEQALAIAREIGDRSGESTRLGHLGIAYSVRGELDRAIGYYQQALAIAQSLGDRRAEGKHLGNLGLAYRDQGQVLAAIGTYEDAIRIARDLGNRQGEGHQLTNLASASLDLGQIDQALENYQKALDIAREIGDRGLEELVLGNLSDAYYGLGEMAQAIDSAEQALTIAREIDDRRGEGYWLGNQGKAYVFQGDLDRAVEALSQSITIAHEIHEPRIENHAHAQLARLYLHHKRYGEALAAVRRARAIAVEETAASTAALYGVILAHMQQPDPARSAFKEALEMANATLAKTPGYFVARYVQALALTGLAVFATDPADGVVCAEEARAAYQKARENCAGAGVVSEAMALLDALKALDSAGVLA
jgi:tetratricopeptide (TPR) repeat protein